MYYYPYGYQHPYYKCPHQCLNQQFHPNIQHSQYQLNQLHYPGLHQQFFDTVQCCDYYSEELDEVYTACIDEGAVCNDIEVINGYTFKLIVQSTQDDCSKCHSVAEVTNRLSEIPAFKNKQWVLTKKTSHFRPILLREPILKIN